MNQTGSSDNKYQYAGEQFDSTLGDYYLRQRFYDTSSGRFGRMDAYQGSQQEPLSLHKYIYANGNPTNGIDPTGYSTLQELLSTLDTYRYLVGAALAVVGLGYFFTQTSQGQDLIGSRGRSKDYDSMDEAGIAAIRKINPISIADDNGKGKEYGGIIAKNIFNGKYFYTKAKRGSGDAINVTESGLGPLYSYVVTD